MPNKGSFYILQGTIFYNLIDGGVGHSSFWKELVMHLFKTLDPQTRRELLEACYGCDRGRVTEDEAGVVHLLGTPGCRHNRAELRKVFDIQGLKPPALVLNFADDEHYKTVRADVAMVNDCLRFEGITKPKRVEVVQFVEGGLFVKLR